jgi:hypothetical protein
LDGDEEEGKKEERRKKHENNGYWVRWIVEDVERKDWRGNPKSNHQKRD